MTKPMVRIHNTETDEVIDREMTDEEYEYHVEMIKIADAQLKEIEAQASAKEALLDRLGITQDEAKLLLS